MANALATLVSVTNGLRKAQNCLDTSRSEGNAELKEFEFQRHAAELEEERQELTEELPSSEENNKDNKAIELLEATWATRAVKCRTVLQ